MARDWISLLFLRVLDGWAAFLAQRVFRAANGARCAPYAYYAYAFHGVRNGAGLVFALFLCVLDGRAAFPAQRVFWAANGARCAPYAFHGVHNGTGLDFHIVFARVGRVGGIPGATGFPGGEWRAMRTLPYLIGSVLMACAAIGAFYVELSSLLCAGRVLFFHRGDGTAGFDFGK
jgi:hypothetical protein